MTMLNMTEREKHHLLEGIVQTLDDGIIVLDRDFTIVLANAPIERRYARKVPLVGRKCFAALYDREGTCPACPYLRSLRTKTPQRQIIKLVSHNNRSEWYEHAVYLFDDEQGMPGGAIEHIKDLGPAKDLEERLRDESARRQLLAEQSPDGIVLLDLEGKVLEANPRFAAMLGYAPAEVESLHIWDWDTRWERERLLEMLRRTDVSSDRYETTLRRKDGTCVPVEVSSNGTVLGGNKVIFALVRDVTEKRALEEEIRELGIRDPLTGLYNRRYVFERLAEIAAENARGGGGFCVSILDVDHLNTVNHVHGPKAADLALQEFAHTISKVLRPYDLFGRLGGGEFVIVSRNATEAETTAMIDRVLKMIREKTFTFEGHKIQFTLSCGLAHSAEFQANATSIEAMSARAKERLQRAKAEGRDRSVGPLSAVAGTYRKG